MKDYKRNKKGEIKTGLLNNRELQDASKEAREQERSSYSKLVYGNLKEGTPEWDEAYDDYSKKYYDRERIERKEEQRWLAEGCAIVIGRLIVISTIGYLIYYIYKSSQSVVI